MTRLDPALPRRNVPRLGAVAVMAALALAPQAVRAQGLLDVAPGAAAPTQAQRWSLTLGALGAVKPDYEGSDSYGFTPLPVIDLRYSDLFFASVRDGIGVNVVREDWLKLGPVVRFRPGRDQDDNRALYGLGDVGATVEGGVLATLGEGPVRLRLEAAQGLNGGGHRGFQARGDLTYGMRLGSSVLLAGGPSLTFADREFTQSYFGITADQARRSGYRAYDAKAGLKDAGFGVTATYLLGRGFALTGIAEVKRLLGDAADSPIVRDETQGFLGLGLSWRGMR
jgi:outer membrane scaffolding protein for murein synthesis (MipA/OmpV family)